MRNSGSLSALGYRDFRLFWASQWVSLSGTWMHMTAQGWLVYELTRSPLYLGLVSTASSAPILLFSLMGGVVADRTGKRNLLIATQALSILPVLFLGIMTDTGHINVWAVMVLVFLLGTINAFDIPARQSFISSMVGRESLLNAIALNSAVFNGARMVGPALAGVIIAAFGLTACFYINAASYVPVVVALTFISARGRSTHGGTDMLREIADGMRFVMREPEVLRPILLVSMFSLFGLPFVSQLPVFADRVLSVGARGYGFLVGASGIGAFSMAAFIALKGQLRRPAAVLGIASVVFPSALFAFSLSTSYPLSLGLMVIAGLAVVGFLATANSAVQLKSPDELRGRVMSVYTFMFLGMTPIGHAIVGLVAEAVGSAMAVRYTSAICLVVSLFISWGMNRG